MFLSFFGVSSSLQEVRRPSSQVQSHWHSNWARINPGLPKTVIFRREYATEKNISLNKWDGWDYSASYRLNSGNVCVCVCVTVKGAWSCWSSWSLCSVGCGSGHYQRTRSCNSPAATNGGDICIGLHTEEALCNTHTCDGKVTHTHSV